MNEQASVVRWVEELSVSPEGYTKHVVELWPDGSTKRKEVRLGYPIMPNPGTRAKTPTTNFNVRGERFVAVGRHFQATLTRLSTTRATAALAPWGIVPSKLNPVWEAKADERRWLIDSVTLLEKSVVPLVQVLPLLLSPWRSAIGRIASDEENVWICPRRLTPLGFHDPLWYGSGWYFDRQTLATVCWWLDAPERGRELDRCLYTLLSKKPLYLPASPPFESWRMEGDVRGDTVLVTHLLATHATMPMDKTVWLLPEDERFGLRFEAPEVRKSGDGTGEGAEEGGLKPGGRHFSKFIDADSKDALSEAVGQSLDDLQAQARRIRSAHPASRLPVFEVVDAIEASHRFDPKEYYCALAWLTALTGMLGGGVAQILIRDYLNEDGSVTPQFLPPSNASPEQTVLWGHLAAALDAYLAIRKRLPSDEGVVGFRGFHPEAKLIHCRRQGSELEVGTPVVVITNQIHRITAVAGMRPADLIGSAWKRALQPDGANRKPDRASEPMPPLFRAPDFGQKGNRTRIVYTVERAVSPELDLMNWLPAASQPQSDQVLGAPTASLWDLHDVDYWVAIPVFRSRKP